MSTTTLSIGKNKLAKQTDKSSRKTVYLLGKDSDGIKYWLESPSWDCGWYWGFGYVETYQQNWAPSKARDISSHQHINSSFIGKHSYYNSEIKSFVESEYTHNIYDSPKLEYTTFNEEEGWILSELFNTFYKLRDSAELFNRGGAHTTTNPCADILKNSEYENYINQVLIPAVTAKIMEILSPAKV